MRPCYTFERALSRRFPLLMVAPSKHTRAHEHTHVSHTSVSVCVLLLALTCDVSMALKPSRASTPQWPPCHASPFFRGGSRRFARIKSRHHADPHKAHEVGEHASRHRWHAARRTPGANTTSRDPTKSACVESARTRVAYTVGYPPSSR
jgi:hypothetical protein